MEKSQRVFGVFDFFTKKDKIDPIKKAKKKKNSGRALYTLPIGGKSAWWEFRDGFADIYRAKWEQAKGSIVKYRFDGLYLPRFLRKGGNSTRRAKRGGKFFYDFCASVPIFSFQVHIMHLPKISISGILQKPQNHFWQEIPSILAF